MANFFEDGSFTSDHTANLLNKGLIDGSVDQSDNSSTAVGSGAVSAANGSTANVASGFGAVSNAGDGDVNQAFGHGQVISDSFVGQNAANSPGALQVGGHADGAGFGFGHSVVGVASGNEIGGDGAISGLGSSHNQSHIIADHGAAVAEHNAFGSNFQDESFNVEERNLTEIDHSSNVTNAQGHSFAGAEQDFHPHATHVVNSEVAGDDISHFFHG